MTIKFLSYIDCICPSSSTSSSTSASSFLLPFFILCFFFLHHLFGYLFLVFMETQPLLTLLADTHTHTHTAKTLYLQMMEEQVKSKRHFTSWNIYSFQSLLLAISILLFIFFNLGIHRHCTSSILFSDMT